MPLSTAIENPLPRYLIYFVSQSLSIGTSPIITKITGMKTQR